MAAAKAIGVMNMKNIATKTVLISVSTAMAEFVKPALNSFVNEAKILEPVCGLLLCWL